jgi:prefoldin beta subunit
MEENKQQELLMQFQTLQEQLQNIMIQKENGKLQVLEIDNALEELKKTKDKVYKSSGMILIKKDPKTIAKELEDKKENLEIRVKNLEKQDKLIKDKLMELQQKITGTPSTEVAE